MCFTLKKKYKHLVVHYCYLFRRKKLVHYVNIYCTLLIVENMKNIRGLISVVKLRVYVNIVIWCTGFVLGEKIKKEVTSCHAGRKVKLI